jgi:mannose-6-phosphate isomerase-like protein (cupin superfamily)
MREEIMKQVMAGPIIRSQDGEAVDMGSLGARFLLDATATGGRVGIVEHWIPPHTLAAPLHRHSREDEYSLVLKGRMGAMLGDRVVEAGPGDFVFKVRDEWHTFWNAGDEECRLLEIISPGGFEELFREMGSDPDAMTGDLARTLDAKYGLEVDYDSIERICVAQGLMFPV